MSPWSACSAIGDQTAPTPVGLSTVRFISGNGATLQVRGLDGIDGTPSYRFDALYPLRDTAG